MFIIVYTYMHVRMYEYLLFQGTNTPSCCGDEFCDIFLLKFMLVQVNALLETLTRIQ